MTKICIKCNIEKPIEDFSKHSGCKDGRYNACRKCKGEQNHAYYMKHEEDIRLQRSLFKSENLVSIKERNNAYYHKNKKEIRIRARNRNIKHKEMVILTKAKQRAKEKGWDFNLTIDDIIIPTICPVLGIPIYRDLKKLNDNSPTLDRIDNTKGYIKGNICVISQRANVIKSFGSLEDHQKIIDYIKLRSPPVTTIVL